MKKRIIIIALSFIAFTGLAAWEGTAAIAPEGELPASGFFVATNSFPKNTVVDITCLETNRTTRAIVANGLDSPALLAIISREAAELIGMKPGSVSAIRIVQPTDPVAYLRFAEGVASYFASGDVITEELYSEDTYKPPVSVKDEPVINGPSYVLEPEWRTRGAVPYIPGTPADYTATPVPGEKIEEPPVYVAEPVPEEEVEEEPIYIAEEAVEEEIEEEPVYVAEPIPEEEVEEEPVYIAEPVPEEEVEEEPVYIAEPIPEEEVEEEPVYITEEAVEEQKESAEPVKEFVLTPAEERPPENTIYGIDPSYIIPGITAAPPAGEPAPVPVIDTAFSVPKITQLDSGKYYVQIAAFDRPELVENALRHVDHRYNPVVYKVNDNTYRVLLGPLNQGESAAVMQRFKTIGYKDAFIRYEK